MRRLVLILVATFGAVASVDAQGEPHFTVGAGIAGMRRVARESGLVRESDGLLAGIDLTARAGIIRITGSYSEGTLADGATDAEFRYVEGSAAVLVRVAPWLAVGTGVRVHRVDEVDPERWVAWGAGGRVDLPILGRTVQGHATYFQGLGGEVNLPDGKVNARSGEVGLTFRPGGPPLQLELLTRIDQNDASGRTRTLQQLAFRVEWSLW